MTRQPRLAPLKESSRRPSLSTLRRLKAPLDRLYDTFNQAESAVDPVQVVRRYTTPADREVVAFCAAALAFGRVASVLSAVGSLLAVLGDRPAAYVQDFDPTRDGDRLRPLVHRWIRGADLIALLWISHRMIAESGSIEQFFLDGHAASAPDVGPALTRFSARARAIDLDEVYGSRDGRRGVTYFFPRPDAGSACKRLNLFLRWMVRRDAVDLGVWSGLSPSKLVVPLDTHVIRVGRCLGLTRYRSPGWGMASEITESLRRLDPEDPVRYDFAMCHLGMMDACGFNRPQRDDRCPLRGVCRPTGRKRRASPGPFVRR
ncbi:MAG: TIGR02757 family protein [Vicinamibacterales bacterium]|nr:TIGR02757 family protein [Vicinamibacterales bacterium]